MTCLRKPATKNAFWIALFALATVKEKRILAKYLSYIQLQTEIIWSRYPFQFFKYFLLTYELSS